MIGLKYSAPRFGSLNETERDLYATKALLSISVITGWTIPNPGPMLDVLVEQFMKKMLESYANINIEEVEYAFRNKGLDIKDWGKALNLSMIDEVLKPYLHDRADLSMQEEKISTHLMIKSEDESREKKQMSDAEWEEWLTDIANYEVNKIPCDSYEYLARTGKIVLTAKQKHKYMERAIIYLSGALDPTSLEGIDLAKMKTKGEFSPAVTGSLITISKRIAVFDYFHINSNKDNAETEIK